MSKNIKDIRLGIYCNDCGARMDAELSDGGFVYAKACSCDEFKSEHAEMLEELTDLADMMRGDNPDHPSQPYYNQRSKKAVIDLVDKINNQPARVGG